MRLLQVLLFIVLIGDVFSYYHPAVLLYSRRSLYKNRPYAVNNDDTGFFRLPERDNSENNQISFPDYEEKQEDFLIDDLTKNRVFRQLLFAFDNYQEWEIREMNQKLQKMPLQFQKLLQLTVTAEDIEAAAEKDGGFDEYLYDALRTCRSSIRMWGKDAEFFDNEGNDKRDLEKPLFSWPSWMKK